ncbi:MAG: Transposase, Mutator family [Candidatus Methanoperedenaceae archaeon GB50]|nr:MAG: Transposase, Mutator family [Candidatus Methanoperedenaceae archaeon GB50]
MSVVRKEKITGMAASLGAFQTPFGIIEDVTIPRGRKGGFVPKVIERFEAFKTKIAKIVVEMFTLGISTRKIKRVTKLVIGKEIKKTEASRLNQSIKAENYCLA